MNEIMQAALAFRDAGVSVVPAAMDGSKAPIGTWKKYQLAIADEEQLSAWFNGSATGIGIVCGKVSGNLEMVELEGRAVAEGCLDEIREIAINSGLGDLWSIISNGYVERTPSGGIHFLWRIADEPVPGNTKFARRPGDNNTVLVYAESRGEGGFVVTAPSSGAVHPSGQPWQLLVGSPASIPMLSWEEREAIVSVFKSIDSMPEKESIVASLQTQSATSGDKPGDDLNERGDWSEILVGWKKVYTANRVTYWRRPGKDSGISATTGRNDADNLFVFTSSSTFEQERPYSKFAAFAHLHHNDDFSAAARDLRSKGYGANTASLLPSLGELMTTPNLSLVPNLDADHVEEVRERSSWYPRPLDLNGEVEIPAPEFLSRNDGHRLFYRGKINALLGESESGKTWVALLAVKQALELDQQVIYLDFEDSGKGILARLRSLAITEARFAHFTYANPDQNLALEERMDLLDGLRELKPELIIVDGVNAAMTLLNLELTSNRDATFFSQQLLKPLASSGACVITIDHVPKSKDNRGNYAIGAQAKRADINGCAIAVEVTLPFGKGMNGELALKVTKDRPGAVRENSKEAKFAGTVSLRSSAEGNVVMVIEAPQMAGDKTRPTHLMEKVSKLLEAAPMPLSKNAVIKETAGRREWVLIAIQNLVDEKYIAIENGSRNSLNLRSLRQYRETEEVSSPLHWQEVDDV